MFTSLHRAWRDAAMLAAMAMAVVLSGVTALWPGQRLDLLRADAKAAVQPSPAPAGATPPGPGPAPPAVGQSHYRATVLKVVDGDTFEAHVALWPGHYVVTRVRLAGVDAAERAAPCAEARERAELARNRLAEWVADGLVTLHDVRPDKYAGRVVALARDSSGRDLGGLLLAADLARPSARGRRADWCARR